MKIDLSGSLYETIKKSVSEYNALKDVGDEAKAKRKAGEISRLYRQLAEMNPATRKENIERSGKWESVSTGKPLSKPKTQQTHQTGFQQKTQTEKAEEQRQNADNLITTSQVRWADIGGLDRVKQLMMETIVIAGLKKPDSIKPWKGILLFGAPGTGKTLLASAAAGSLDAAFFNVKSENLLSKYFGESSKQISALYQSAREHAPSIVFIDEFDALTPSRDSETSEASRNVLSTLLTEMDGLADKKSNQLILTLAATNTPWDMDNAILSRFPRRIYVTLPDEAAVSEILKIQLKDMDVSKISFDTLAKNCVDNFYSGRDLSALSQQAIWTMVNEENPNLHKLAELPFSELKERSLNTRPLTMEDFAEAFSTIRSPLTRDSIEKYEQWNSEFGAL